uniref:Uncharacterized protein n=1 Tax=Anopheles farauti TaxID=69004 RepID=A0A182QMG7_9DIPT
MVKIGVKKNYFVWWRSWQMISDGLESVGIGLVLNTVELTVGSGVGVATRNDLFRLLRSQVAEESFLLVLDTITGGVTASSTFRLYLLEAIAAVTVVDVFVAQDRDGSSLLEVTLEASASRTTRLESVAGAIVRWSRWSLRVVGTEPLLCLSGWSKGCDGWVTTLTTLSTSSRRWQVLIGRRTKLTIASRSVQEVTITTTASVGCGGRGCTVQVVQTGCTCHTQERTEQELLRK